MRRHRPVALLAVLLGAAVGLAGVLPQANAEPTGTSGTDAEGGTPALRKELEAAAKGYLDAKAKLDRSKQRQRELTGQLQQVEAQFAILQVTVGEVARAAYQNGPLGPLAALLDSGSPVGLVERAATLEAVASVNDKQIRQLVDARARIAQAKAAIEVEIKQQDGQLRVMAKRKQQAEAALKAVGGGAVSGPTGSGSATARPAPRNSDGSWPSESCSVNDPTTSGCITTRTLNALQQAKAAGFTRYVSCYRSGGSGEHPKGRACDFSAQAGGFGGVATGGDRTYGNNLAAYFVRNADRLGVMYVIWFKQIWMASTGWRAYQSGNGDPSSDHTNHVHLSVY